MPEVGSENLTGYRSSWPKQALSQLVDPQRGITYGIVQPGQHDPIGVPILRVNDIRNGRIDVGDIRRVSPAIAQQYQRTNLRGGEVLLTVVGTIGETVVVPMNMAGWNIARAIAVLPVLGEVSSEWVRLCLQSAELQGLMRDWCNTTVQPTLNLAEVAKLPIPIPPPATRDRVVEILGRLDDKIEVNRRINRTLERMAQALYKHWFVDFGPFQDGEFVESAVGVVPRGWEITTLEELVEIEANVINPQSHPEEVFDHYSIPAYDEQRLPVAEPGAAVKSGKYLIHSKSVLVSKLNPATPRVWTVFDPKCRRSFSSTEFIHYICRSPLTWSFVNGYLRSQAFLDEFRAHVAGTTGSRQRVPPKVTMSFKLVKPPVDVLRAFDELVGPYLVLMQRNLEEGQVLAATRDYLLPRLLAGEVEM